jgi:probable F420-dependent oxidoreductase
VPSDYESTFPYSADGRMPAEGTAFPDALDWIAFLSAATERIVFGTGMLILPEHNPLMVAKRAATIDRLSGGRLILGVGVGWMKEEFDALGVQWKQRGPRADEYVQVMRRLWSGDETTFNGKFVQLERVRCLPKPIQIGGIPIVIGGHSEASASRAGRIGDGFYPAAATPEQVARLLRTLRQSGEDAGRDPAAIEITAGAGAIYDLDVIKRYEDLGVSRVMVSPPENPRDLGEYFEVLHETLISKLLPDA